MDSSNRDQVRRLVGEIAGTSLDDVSPEEMQRVLRDAGLPVDDPTRVADLMQRWDALQPAVFAAALDPETDAFLVVDPVFQAAMERLGPRATDPDALLDEAPAIRAIVVTRLIDGLVEDGGWAAVFVGGPRELLPVAVDGYRLLGLDQHAALADRALARGFDPADASFWEDLEGAWFDLPSAEVARAASIGANSDIR
jgi:hypothetical protein